jgi:hypothetical protein
MSKRSKLYPEGYVSVDPNADALVDEAVEIIEKLEEEVNAWRQSSETRRMRKQMTDYERPAGRGAPTLRELFLKNLIEVPVLDENGCICTKSLALKAFDAALATMREQPDFPI